MDTITNEDEFRELALRHYDNPQCFSMSEFLDDVKRFQYVSNLLERYHQTNLINERLILNHLIILHNLFGRFTAVGLFYRVSPNAWAYLKTYLSFLHLLPRNFNELKSVKVDRKLLKKLERI